PPGHAVLQRPAPARGAPRASSSRAWRPLRSDQRTSAPSSVASSSTAWNPAPSARATSRASPNAQPTSRRSGAHEAGSAHAAMVAIAGVVPDRFARALTPPASEHVSRLQDRTNRIAPRGELLGVLRGLEAPVGPVALHADEGAGQERGELPDEAL